ncbi:MAG: 5-methylthioadenosine phosphorylase [Acidimicrobiaceae bacterium]|jgi:5'-methylthioadenosine phosphorylase|nr:5-methylthioadenosine phosphorylase [Acidimicrobiaceae bacterium]MDQ1419119.1 5-methylthioadenosine phosphorylase [Acidimicrobiaceae bacterium]
MAAPVADIAVIGGSGFYSFLEDTRQLPLHTPYGPPSAPVTIGLVGDRPVAFLPRHGLAHEFPPHRVNYRANMWALRTLGVRRVVAPCAVGSLRPEIAPGDLVILDQLVDRTSGRPDTFVDGPIVGHVSFADPYCPELTSVLAAAQRDAPTLTALTVHRGGTVVVIQGPRFSTRAESRWFRSAGWDVVNMTQYPEAYLARELGMCYCGLALVTDYDTGLEGVEGIAPVTMQQVFDTLAANVSRTRDLLFTAIPAIPATPGCACAAALASGPLGDR